MVCVQWIFLCIDCYDKFQLRTHLVRSDRSVRYFHSRATLQTFFNDKRTENMKTAHVIIAVSFSIKLEWKLSGYILSFYFSPILKIASKIEDFGLSKCLQNKFQCNPNISMLRHLRVQKSNRLEKKSKHLISDQRKVVRHFFHQF